MGPVAIAAVGFLWALLWPVTDALASHDVAGYLAAGRAGHLQSAREAARTQILTLGAGLFAGGALFYTARNFTLARRQLDQSRQQFTEQLALSRTAAQDSAEAARRTLELTEQGQVTDRYTKAIEQLGSDKPDIRVGGIYALERIARDSARDHPTIMEVMSAFIREHSPKPPLQTEADEGPTSPAGGESKSPPKVQPDVQASLTVIGRRDPGRDIRPIDLTRTNLYTANLRGANLSGADLRYANLSFADLKDANLTAADLYVTDLSGATLWSANLAGAHAVNANLVGGFLGGAKLSHTNFYGSNLNHAQLVDTDLTGADLRYAHLIGALFNRANLKDADLSNANLAEADFTDAVLTGANFTDAKLARAQWPEDHAAPDGWRRVAKSGRLTRG